MLKDLTNAPRYHQFLTGNFRLGTCIFLRQGGQPLFTTLNLGVWKIAPLHMNIWNFFGNSGGGGGMFVFLLEIFNRQKQGNFKKNIHTCIISFWYDSNSIKPISIRHFCPIFHTFLTENINMYVYLYIYHTYCTNQKYFGIKIRIVLK